MHCRIVGRNDGCSFGEAIALINRNPDGSKKLLLREVEQRTTTHTKADTISKNRLQLLKDELVSQFVGDPLRQRYLCGFLKPVAIDGNAGLQTCFKQFLNEASLGGHAVFHFVHEVARERGNGEHEMRIGLLKVDGNIFQGILAAAAGINKKDGKAFHCRCVYAHRVCKRMVEGQNNHQPVALLHIEILHGIVAVAVIVEVGEHDALRVACGAAGVGNRHRLVGGYVLLYFSQACLIFCYGQASLRIHPAHEQHIFRLDASSIQLCMVLLKVVVQIDQANAFQLRCSQAFQSLFDGVRRQHHAFAGGMFKPEMNLFGQQFDRKGHVDAAHTQNAIFGDHPIVASFGKDGNLVIRTKAGIKQGRGKPARFLEHCAEGGCVPACIAFLIEIRRIGKACGCRTQ